MPAPVSRFPVREPASRVVERIVVSRQDAEAMERDILIRRHIERYAIVRQFVYGRTVDCACGVGYGTHLLAKNADVTAMYGVDADPEAIAHARREFGSPRIEFVEGALETVTIPDVDCLVSLETIEHLADPRALYEFAKRCGVREIIVSFPSKKTTHYNPHHHWDLTVQDVLEVFASEFVMLNTFSYTFDTQFVHLGRLARSGARPRRFRGAAER